jgi:hypothetical protein
MLIKINHLLQKLNYSNIFSLELKINKIKYLSAEIKTEILLINDEESC